MIKVLEKNCKGKNVVTHRKENKLTFERFK